MSPNPSSAAPSRPTEARGERERRSAAPPREREQFDRLLRRMGGLDGAGDEPGREVAVTLPDTWMAALRPLAALGRLAEDAAAAQSIEAAQALTHAGQRAQQLQAAGCAARAEQSSATTEALQRSLAGSEAGVAFAQGAMQAGVSRAEALAGVQPAQRFDVTLNDRHGLSLQLQASREAAPPAAVQAHGGAAADRASGPWSLTLAAHGRDFQAAARHLPRLQERLRSLAGDEGAVHLRDNRRDDA